MWERELESDFDREFILEGIHYGFRIIKQDSDLEPVEFKNHKSSLDDKVKNRVEQLIQKEIDLGNYVITSRKPTIVSAIGAVPKGDSDIRIIHDCSLPAGRSLNSFAPEYEKYSYESLDSAVSLIKKDYFLAKVDIKSAYRHVPIHPECQEATGLKWIFADGSTKYMYDVKLPFGACASPTIFHRISQAIKRMMMRRGYTKIVAYQDDFLVIGETYNIPGGN